MPKPHCQHGLRRCGPYYRKDAEKRPSSLSYTSGARSRRPDSEARPWTARPVVLRGSPEPEKDQFELYRDLRESHHNRAVNDDSCRSCNQNGLLRCSRGCKIYESAHWHSRNNRRPEGSRVDRCNDSDNRGKREQKTSPSSTTGYDGCRDWKPLAKLDREPIMFDVPFRLHQP